jgi:hypothetical protein
MTRAGQSVQDTQERTVGTGLPGQGIQDRIARKGHPKQDSRDRTDTTRQSEHEV